MKKYITIISLLLFFAPAHGQMTLAHHYPRPVPTPWIGQSQFAIVNLALSGKKIMIMRRANGDVAPDTMYFYNMDYSYWKKIPCPQVDSFGGQFNINENSGTAVGVYYPSETLFNADPLLEVAVYYETIYGITPVDSKILVINENGTIVDSIEHVGFDFHVYKDTSGVFKAIANVTGGIDVFNLPGTLPCDACGGYTLGITQVEKPKEEIFSMPIPNPSSDQVKIAFTLPEGAGHAELQVFNASGQKVKTYEVDNTFGYVMLDNSKLPAGTYLYNIVVQGHVSTSQKFVVVK